MTILNQFKEVYEKRWKKSLGTSDDDILCKRHPKSQVQFFYLNYNKFISKLITEHFPDPQNRRLLEVGCGRATSSIFQNLELKIDVLPTDYSEAALEVAKKNLKKYGVKAVPEIADLYDLPFDDFSFDVVISLGVMEHIIDPVRAYREMYRVLKVNGLMISMNVPEHNNIQRIAKPFNSVFLKIENVFLQSSSKPWLDKETQSKTADVYRANGYAEDFADFAAQAGFQKACGFEMNPFPTFSPIPKTIDIIITIAYGLVLNLRKLLMPRSNPFSSTRKNSRCHFVVGYRL